MYTKTPSFVTDLTMLSTFKSISASKTAHDIRKMFQEVNERLASSTLKYKQDAEKKRKEKKKEFVVGDLVMAHV